MSKTLVQQQFGAHAANYVDSQPHARGASLTRVVELVAPKSDWRALDGLVDAIYVCDPVWVCKQGAIVLQSAGVRASTRLSFTST